MGATDGSDDGCNFNPYAKLNIWAHNPWRVEPSPLEKELTGLREGFDRIREKHSADKRTQFKSSVCRDIIRILKDPLMPEYVKRIASDEVLRPQNLKMYLEMEAIEKVTAADYLKHYNYRDGSPKSDRIVYGKLIRILKDADMPEVVKEVVCMEAAHLTHQTKSMKKALEEFARVQASGSKKQLAGEDIVPPLKFRRTARLPAMPQKRHQPGEARKLMRTRI